MWSRQLTGFYARLFEGSYVISRCFLSKESPQADSVGPLMRGEDPKVHVYANFVKRQAKTEAFIVVEVCQDVAECPAVVALDRQGEGFSS
jgi:hypothetical protein